ncbi:unnamed protein product [Rotaria sp. Silwood2]|nr:unnamed protein product [Rotaria sp. Silwood2]CAF3088648.1 unnamed protein product [Rotaria sp. Silwood2]
MDESLPMTVFDFLVSLSQVLDTIVLVIFLNPWSFIPAIIAASGMLFVRYRFAPCSRDLKRLVGTTRIIRSYHAENICSEEFHYHLDNNTRVNYLIATLNRWSAMRFDWVSIIFIALIIVLAIIVRISQQQFSAVEIALTLTYSLNLMGLFQWTIRLDLENKMYTFVFVLENIVYSRQSVEVETQMTSVERILEYCSLEQEPSNQLSFKYRSPANWPSQGRIVFKNVSMSHSKELNSPLIGSSSYFINN